MLDAAAEVLAEQGPDASIDEIARRAGVGHGTVFRRFPTKESLLAAVMCLRLEQFSAWADESLAEPDAGAAFESFVWRIAESFARDRALCEGLPRCGETAQLLEAKQRLHDLIGALVTRAQDQGPSGATSRQTMCPFSSGPAILGSNQMDAGDAWRRYVAVVLDGMRAPGAAR